ncbi:MAG: AmmeMemoRadiSam system protein B [Bacteroidales bacterium]
MQAVKIAFNSVILLIFMLSCSRKKEPNLRSQVDTIGFAQYSWQMDSVMSRIYKNALQPGDFRLPYDTVYQTGSRITHTDTVAGVICPHDDYSYAGPLYESVLSTIHSPFVILIGVAHKARAMDIENRIVFGSPVPWSAPYGKVQISSIREKVIEQLDTSDYLISDSLLGVEHSLEALLPFLQYHHRDLTILPILVPAMNLERIEEIAKDLANSLAPVLEKEGLQWGTGYSIVISSDGVHYGDDGWGGKNFASFGTGIEGYSKAFAKENYLLDSCLCGMIEHTKIKAFTDITLQQNDFREYAWTWCGRYSVPLGLELMRKLAEKQHNLLTGKRVGYLSSIDHVRIPVEDLGMGLTAPASLRHWVGYPGVAYSLLSNLPAGKK